MRNTADLAMVYGNGVAVQGVLYQSILNAKLTGRKKLGRKMCTCNRDDCKLENTVKQSWLKHLGELHKEWTEAIVKSYHAQTSSGKELPSHFWTRDNIRSILPGLWRKRTGLLLSGLKSSFQMKVNFAFHLERSRSQSLEDEWKGTESMLLEVQCEVSTVSEYLGGHVICWCWSTVFSEVHSQRSHLAGNCNALHTSFCWQALWRCWFHFPAGLGTCPHYQKLVQWPWCYCARLASKLAWPEPQIIYGYCQEEDERHQTKQCSWSEGRYQSNLGFHYTWAVPQADWLHATPHWCSNSCKRRPNQECIEMNILFRSLTFLFKISFFLLILCNIKIFWDTEFWVFIICKP